MLSIVLTLNIARAQVLSNTRDREILYKLVEDYEGGEYVEGSYCIYDIVKKCNSILEKHTMVSYEEAWLTVDNEYLMLDILGYRVLDSDKKLLYELRCNKGERPIGGQYDSKRNKLFFLLRKDDRKPNTPKTVDLCTFDPVSRQMERIIPNIGISYQNIEEPFKKMFFVSDNELLIYQYGGEFAVVDLNTRQIVDQVSFGYRVDMAQAKQGLISGYLRERGTDLYYELSAYNHQAKRTHHLLGKTVKKEWKYSTSYLRTDPTRADFCFQVDSQVYHYQDGACKPLDLEVIEILAYQAGVLLYRDKNMQVHAYQVDE